MKNLICILSIVILCMAASVLFAAEATLTVEGETHLATTSGKVGIGTTRPTQELTIETTGVNNPGIALVQNQAGVDGDILFYEGSALSSSLRFHNAGGLEFIDRSPSVVSRFLINSSGNVGIGTTSPQQKLHVNGNVRAKGFIMLSETIFLLHRNNFKIGEVPITVSVKKDGKSNADVKEFTDSLFFIIKMRIMDIFSKLF